MSFYGTNLPGDEAEGDIAKKGSVPDSGTTGPSTIGGIISEPAGTSTPVRSNGPALSRNG